MVILGGHARPIRVLRRDFYHDTVALDIGELPLLRRRLEVKLKLRVEHVPVVAQYPAQGRQLAVYHPPLEVVPRPQLFEPALLFLPARSFLSTFPHASWMRFPSGSSPLSSFSFQTWYAVCAAENRARSACSIRIH